jgi:copper(I)-binding protein
VRSARLGPTPGSVAAVYLTLENTGERDERLLGVRSPAESSELHETVLDGDTARMEARPEGFVIPAGGTLELVPGGKHVMLVGLPGSLAVGDTLELVLQLESAGERTLLVPVEERTW